MHGGDGGGGQGLQREVAVGHGVERIGGGPGEVKRLRRHVAIDGEARAGKRRGAERAFVEALARIGEPSPVAGQHLDISEVVMAEGDGLRRLQMGEAGHHRGRMGQGLLRERELKLGEQTVDRGDLVPDIEAEVGRDLIVARPRRMQLAGEGSDQLGQAALDVQMDVLKGAEEVEGAALDLGRDHVEAARDLVRLVLA